MKSDGATSSCPTGSALPSPEEVEAARTAAGGRPRDQLAAWGVPWPPAAGWKQKLAHQRKAHQRKNRSAE